MLSLLEVEKIIKELGLHNNADIGHQLSADVSYIAYRVECFKCGSTNMTNKHIDIEFNFGDYYELHEKEALFQYISKLCNLQDIDNGEEADQILYKNGFRSYEEK